jgi:hypothetical protein
MIASIALVHDLTMVTHNTADFQSIPGLRLADWLTPWLEKSLLEKWAIDPLNPLKGEKLILIADPQRMIRAGAQAVVRAFTLSAITHQHGLEYSVLLANFDVGLERSKAIPSQWNCQPWRNKTFTIYLQGGFCRPAHIGNYKSTTAGTPLIPSIAPNPF